MLKLRDLKKKHNEHVMRIRELEKADRNLTDEESNEVEKRFAEATELKQKIEHREKIKSLELAKVDEVIPKSEKRQFSLTNAIKCLITGKFNGYEAEVHQEYEKRGHNFEADGIIIPSSEVYEKRVVDNQSALISDPIRPELAQLSLREASIMDKLGCMRISATGNFNYPKNNNATTSSFFTGDGGSASNDSIAESDATFVSESSEPHYLSTMTGWTLNQLKQMSGNLSLEMLLRKNMTMSMAETLDNKMLNGNSTTASAEPDGLLKLLGTDNNTALALKSSAPIRKWTWDDITTAVKDFQIQFKMNKAEPVWVVSPLVFKEWSDTQRFSSTDGESIADEVVGEVVTNHIADTKVVLGQFSEFIVVTFDSIMLSLGMINDDFKKGIQRLRAIGCFDFILDRKEAFRQITITRS